MVDRPVGIERLRFGNSMHVGGESKLVFYKSSNEGVWRGGGRCGRGGGRCGGEGEGVVGRGKVWQGRGKVWQGRGKGGRRCGREGGGVVGQGTARGDSIWERSRGVPIPFPIKPLLLSVLCTMQG